MTNLPLVQYFKSFQNLGRNFFGLHRSLGPLLFDVLIQIAVCYIFHRDVDRVRLFKPTKEFDEKPQVLTAC